MTTTIDLWFRDADDDEPHHVGTVDLDDVTDLTQRITDRERQLDTGREVLHVFATHGVEIVWIES